MASPSPNAERVLGLPIQVPERATCATRSAPNLLLPPMDLNPSPRGPCPSHPPQPEHQPPQHGPHPHPKRTLAEGAWGWVGSRRQSFP